MKWVLISIFVLCILRSQVFASDEPFISPSNWGGTGLMEIPTARVIKEDTYRIGVSQIEPYRYYYGAISPIKGFELDGRITEILGLKLTSPAWQGYGNYKDKALDFKYQLISEDRYMPAIAVGIMDPHGTRLYGAQYIVMSKQIYPFDFTLGFGNGRFGKRSLSSQGEGMKIEMVSDTKEWIEDSQSFWGIQFAPSPKYALIFEYSPIKYHKQTSDPGQSKYFQKPVPSNYNFGFRWKPLKWTEIDLSYQRGNEIGVNFSMPFEIGKPILPIYDKPYKEGHIDRLNPLSERVTTALYYSGFSDIGVTLKGDDLWIEAQNDKYYYSTKAIGVILQILSEILPENETFMSQRDTKGNENVILWLDQRIQKYKGLDSPIKSGNDKEDKEGAFSGGNIKKIHITLKENGIPMVEFTVMKADITDLYAERLTVNEFFYLSGIKTDISETLDTQIRYKELFKYGIKPSFQTFLNDPSGFLKYRFGISGWVSYHPWRGASFITGLEGYPLNTVSTTNEPFSIPVRSDLVLYKKEKVALERLMLDQIHKIKHELYGRFAAGLLESQYAGLDGEIGMPMFNGRFIVGLSGSLVKKREPDNFFQLKDNDVKDVYSTAFISTRLNIPKHEASIDLKTGIFLAGDKGSRIAISKFINGVIISAWYSFTDTSIFKDNFNRGYHDKGIAVTIPLRLFKGTDSRTAYNYALSPWTRDVAQDIEHYNTLFDFIDRNTKIFLDKDKKKVY